MHCGMTWEEKQFSGECQLFKTQNSQQIDMNNKGNIGKVHVRSSVVSEA